MLSILLRFFWLNFNFIFTLLKEYLLWVLWAKEKDGGVFFDMCLFWERSSFFWKLFWVFKIVFLFLKKNKSWIKGIISVLSNRTFRRERKRVSSEGDLLKVKPFIKVSVGRNLALTRQTNFSMENLNFRGF